LAQAVSDLLYHQISKILTCYYKPFTTEHISRWHHAAGDFVIRCTDNRVDVRLITIRRYDPMLKMGKSPETITDRTEQTLAALLIFLISLSIRMRLDRLDGIGDMAWADDTAVLGVWSGFLEGLAENRFPSVLLENPVKQFEVHLSSYSVADILELAETIASTLSVGPQEKALIEKQFSRHMETLLETIGSIGFP
jgi:hypothetical protein